jgi:hypothetical protein
MSIRKTLRISLSVTETTAESNGLTMIRLLLHNYPNIFRKN